MVNISKTTEVNPDKTEIKGEQKSRSVRKIFNIDPYYYHFLLLSQSVKIRENKEKYFNIDIKPYYHDIISDKIPMHEWQIWIKEKFDELCEDEKDKGL